jgi:hypothetical protein
MTRHCDYGQATQTQALRVPLDVENAWLGLHSRDTRSRITSVRCGSPSDHSITMNLQNRAYAEALSMLRAAMAVMIRGTPRKTILMPT